VLTTALLIVAAGTAVGVGETAVSGAYDFHLQSQLLETMASHNQHGAGTHQASTGGSWTPEQRQTAAVDVKAAAFGGGLILIANLVVVGWVVALRGGRLDVVPARRRRQATAATVRAPATA
jgi:hypothetical protein